MVNASAMSKCDHNTINKYKILGVLCIEKKNHTQRHMMMILLQ